MDGRNEERFGYNMLKGKTALVTGAAKGIGRAIACAFAREGCNIVLNFHSSSPDDVIREIEGCGVECMPVKGSVADFDFAAGLFKDVKKKFGSVDILVNNAGITKDMLLMRMSEEQFDQVIDVNLKGAFNMIRHAAPIMLKQRSGAIINISSVVGISGNAGQANYAASKAGIIGLTKSAAKEFGSRGVTCNAIAPGFIETDMTEVLSDEVKQGILGAIPLGRSGRADEIAEAALFLAKSGYITGQVINVDGGMVM